MPEPDWLTQFVGSTESVLVLSDAATAHVVSAHGVRAAVVLPAEVEAGRRERVVVTVADRGALRGLVVPDRIRSAAIAVWLSADTGALTLSVRPEWPELTALRARRVGDGWLTVLRFARPVLVGHVVSELARQCVWPDRVGQRGLVVHAGGPVAENVPPDVLLSSRDAASSVEPVEASPVTGRSPYVLRELRGPIVLGELDERVLNPIGFVAATGPTVELASLDTSRGATGQLIRDLRSAAGVRVSLPDDVGIELVRTVAGLAMAGVPLTAAQVPGRAADLLGDSVTGALTAAVDLGDETAREEHSIVLRRGALDTFSSFGWRRAVGALAGVRGATQPRVSIVLATRRPEQLEFALTQVRKQRGVEALELVLAPHGFEVDPGHVREVLGDGVSVAVVAQPASTPFGDVLAAAASAANGDVVLKLDDDDWYGPDVVADLLLARAYSGAEMVGMPAEMHYLAPRRMTVKRGHRSELYAPFVAGGTMMIERGLLREVGSFRSVRKFVDAQLLAAVAAAGGAVYRTHGLGYLLRRDATGHTWEVDMDYLLDPVRVAATWEGFRPSRLLEHGDSEVPVP